MHNKTPKELIAIIQSLQSDNEKLIEEHQKQALEMKQHTIKFMELRSRFELLNSLMEELLVKLKNGKNR